MDSGEPFKNPQKFGKLLLGFLEWGKWKNLYI